MRALPAIFFRAVLCGGHFGLGISCYTPCFAYKRYYTITSGDCMQDTFRIIFDEGPDNVYMLEDVLPNRFGPQALLTNGKQPLLLEEQHHHLDWTPGAVQRITANVMLTLLGMCFKLV